MQKKGFLQNTSKSCLCAVEKIWNGGWKRPAALENGTYQTQKIWKRNLRICNYVFDNSDIIRIFAESFAYNAASCRVLEEAAFNMRAR